MAKIWSENSYAERAKVGALIVKNGMIISDGYNGTPSGFDNCCEIENFKFVPGCEPSTAKECRRGMDGACKGCNYSMKIKDGLRTKPEVLHAEANAITKIAKSTQSSDGATLYVTLSPCLECSKLIIQSGIKRVVYGAKYRITDGLELLEKAGIEIEQFDDEV